MTPYDPDRSFFMIFSQKVGNRQKMFLRPQKPIF